MIHAARPPPREPLRAPFLPSKDLTIPLYPKSLRLHSKAKKKKSIHSSEHRFQTAARQSGQQNKMEYNTVRYCFAHPPSLHTFRETYTNIPEKFIRVATFFDFWRFYFLFFVHLFLGEMRRTVRLSQMYGKRIRLAF